MGLKDVAYVLAALAGVACSGGGETARAPLGMQAEDAGTGGGGSAADAGGGVEGQPARLDSDAVYLYGFARDWNGDWPGLAKVGSDGEFWSGVPQIVRSDGTAMLGLRESDGAPVYRELESVRVAKVDPFDFSIGTTANVADNDETLGICPYPSRLGTAHMVPGTGEVLYSCSCADAYCTDAERAESRWYLNGKPQMPKIGDSSILALGKGNLGLIRRNGALMLWWRDSNKTKALVDGPEYIVEVRATDDGFWMLTGKGGMADLVAKWELARWTLTADGKSKRDGDFPGLPTTHEVKSCQFAADGSIMCLLRNAAGSYVYRLTLGASEATLVRSFPLGAAHPFEPPYVRPGEYSFLVTGVGPKDKN